jgi:hypothetical protein
MVSNSSTLAGLVENVLWNRQFARIVQQCGGLDRLQRRRLGHIERARQPHRVRLNSVDVVARDAVLGLDGRGEGRNGRQIKLIDLCDVTLRIVDPSEPRPQCQVTYQYDRHDRDNRGHTDFADQDGENESGGAGSKVVEGNDAETPLESATAAAVKPEFNRKYTIARAASGAIIVAWGDRLGSSGFCCSSA